MVKKRNLQGYIDHSNKNDPHIISNSIPHKIKLDKHQLNYLHGDLVEFEIIKRKRKGFYYGKINCLKKREINNYVGHIEINKNFAFSIVENKNIHTDIFIPQKNINGAKNGDKVLIKIEKWNKQDLSPIGIIKKVIGRPGDHQSEINSWGKNVYVKIPVVNSKGVFMGPVIKELSNKGIKLNITAVYTFTQAKKIYKNLNKKTKSIISIFAGRMADKGKDPLPIFKKSISLTKKNKNIEILWASTREAYNFIQAKQLDCNIITMPPNIISKINGFGKSFKSMTLDTVRGFLADSRKSRFKI